MRLFNVVLLGVPCFVLIYCGGARAEDAKPAPPATVNLTQQIVTAEVSAAVASDRARQAAAAAYVKVQSALEKK